MSRSLPAWTMARVTETSSGLGDGSPDGWLWARMMAGAVVDDRLAEDFAHPHLGRVDAALVELGQVHHPVAGVQVHHPQLFVIQRAQEGLQQWKASAGLWMVGRSVGLAYSWALRSSCSLRISARVFSTLRLRALRPVGLAVVVRSKMGSW